MIAKSELERKVSRILLENWDPLGVRGIPQAEDEYDGHACEIAPLATECRSDVSYSAPVS
jgi:hypothetical protein